VCSCAGKSCRDCGDPFEPDDQVVDTRLRWVMLFSPDTDNPMDNGAHSDAAQQLDGLYHRQCLVRCFACRWCTPFSQDGWLVCVPEDGVKQDRKEFFARKDLVYVCHKCSVECDGCGEEIGAFPYSSMGAHPCCETRAAQASSPRPTLANDAPERPATPVKRVCVKADGKDE
jgi:hypothetical protein